MTNNVVLTLESGVTQAQVEALVAKQGGKLEAFLDQIGVATVSGTTVEAYQGQPGILSAEPEHEAHTCSA